MKMRSMRARMTLWLSAITALVMLLASTGWLLSSRAARERYFNRSLERMTRRIEFLRDNDFEAGMRRERRRNRRDANREPLTDTERLERLVQVQNAQIAERGGPSESIKAWLVDEKGQVVWRSGPPRQLSGRDNYDRDEPTPAPLEAAESEKVPPPQQNPKDWRSRTLDWKGQSLIIGVPWNQTAQMLWTQALGLGALGLLITGVSAAGAWLMVGKTLAPIDELAHQTWEAAAHPMQLISPENTALLRATSSDKEMVHLVATFNQLLENVREAALSKERFHTAASHELRTPLQALSGHLQVALSRPREAAEYRATIEEAAAQARRLNDLTQNLLFLNRLQTAASVPAQEPLDVVEFCDLALARAGKTIAARHLTLADHLEPLEIEAVPTHLEVLLGNLIENAAKYARENGELLLRIDARKRQIEIENEATPEMAATLERELPRLFEPFYRPDVSRQSSTGGNGLGLAICHAICEANRWKLEMTTDKSKARVLARVEFKSP